jgi:ATP-binding cassette subfamily B protein
VVGATCGHRRRTVRRCSAILVSHWFSAVRNADRIPVIEDGRIVEHGSHDQLLAAGGRNAAMFTAQAAGYR